MLFDALIAGIGSATRNNGHGLDDFLSFLSVNFDLSSSLPLVGRMSMIEIMLAIARQYTIPWFHHLRSLLTEVIINLSHQFLNASSDFSWILSVRDKNLEFRVRQSKPWATQINFDSFTCILMIKITLKIPSWYLLEDGSRMLKISVQSVDNILIIFQLYAYTKT